MPIGPREVKALSGELAALTLVAAATVMGLEEIRVFVSDLVWTVGETSSRAVLGLGALAPFLAVGLAAAAIRLARPRRALWLAVGGLALLRVAEQVSAWPVADMALGALIIPLWGWLLVAVLTTAPQVVALGVSLAVGLDIALRTSFLTIDLPWTSHPAAAALTIGLATAAVLALRVYSDRKGPAERRLARLLPLVAIGPFLALTLALTGNFGQVAARSGAAFPLVAWAMAAGAGLVLWR